MKIVFMGTPEFAVPAFRKLRESRHEIVAVTTQPDRPKGRGKNLSLSPVKEEAVRNQIPVFQPESVKEEIFQDALKKLEPDIIIVVAFGQIIPTSILDMPPLGCVNLHASLLPKYRGAAPVERAIMNGEVVTGNTTMLMDEGMDSGDILLQEKTDIPPEADALWVREKLSESGASLLLETIEKLKKNDIEPKSQNTKEVTFAPRLKKDDGLICWDKENIKIVNQVRGLIPWPVAHSFLKGARVKIWKAASIELDVKENDPGEIVKIDASGISVSCGNGFVLLKELQMEGKKRMDASQFCQGQRLIVGDRFSSLEKS